MPYRHTDSCEPHFRSAWPLILRCLTLTKWKWVSKSMWLKKKIWRGGPGGSVPALVPVLVSVFVSTIVKRWKGFWDLHGNGCSTRSEWMFFQWVRLTWSWITCSGIWIFNLKFIDRWIYYEAIQQLGHSAIKFDYRYRRSTIDKRANIKYYQRWLSIGYMYKPKFKI